jgi:hypothetical protein
VQGQEDIAAICDTATSSWNIPAGCVPIIPEYSPGVGAAGRTLRSLASKRLDIFEDTVPWLGQDGTRNVLQRRGLVKDVDFFLRPTSALATLDFGVTSIAWISSDGFGKCTPKTNTLANLDKVYDFVKAGGVLVADMGTNCNPRVSISIPKPDGTAFVSQADIRALGPSKQPEVSTSLGRDLTGMTGGSLTHGVFPVRYK